MNQPWRRLILGVLLGLLVTALDQWSKLQILTLFQGDGGSVGATKTVLPILDLTLRMNSGISYSIGARLGADGPWPFVAVAGLIIVGLLIYLWRSRGGWVLLALGLVIGGAFGNMIDRIRYGAVVDFLYFHLGSFDCFGVFNLADSAISVGAVVLVFESLFTKPTSHKNTP